MSTVEFTRQVATTVTTNGTLVAGTHQPVDASGGARTMTLPTGVHGGAQVSVEKVDSSANAVSITGTIRGSSSTLNLVWQNESVTFTADPSGSSWWPTAGHKTKASLDAAYGGGGTVIVLAGAGIDPTGTTDSSTAVQTILTNAAANSEIVVPAGAVIRCNTGLTVTKRLDIGGPGQLNFYGLTGSGHSQAISVTADGTRLVGLRIANPAMTTPDNTFGNGNTQFGILIAANDVLVQNCVVDKFQTGIAVDTHGEYERFRIIGNTVSDVLGAGNGASDTTSQNGEDRGDGICCWGSQATITGNVVWARTGSDARIGIHTEALPTQEGTVTAHADSMVTISGNIVFGQFRRGIATEEVDRVAITGNSVADSTWWNIAVLGTANECSVTGNVLKYTRTSTDNQGGAWSPNRSAIMVYGSNGTVQHAVVANNAINVAVGATIVSGICITGGSSIVPVVSNLIVSGNTVHDESGTLNTGVRFLRANTGSQVVGNVISAFQQYGVYLDTATDCNVSNNRLVGAGQSVSGSKGVHFNVTSTDWQINGNTISDCDTGINCVNGSNVQVNNNKFARCNTGINGFGTTTPFVLVGNLFDASVTTVRQSVTSSAVQAGNSN